MTTHLRKIKPIKINGVQAMRPSEQFEDLVPLSELFDNRIDLKGSGPGLYFLFRAAELVYVGQSTTNILSRIGQHLIAGKIFDSFAFIGIDDPERLTRLEADYIYLYRPEYNSTTPVAGRYYTKKMLSRMFHTRSWKLTKTLEFLGVFPDTDGQYDILDLDRALAARRESKP